MERDASNSCAVSEGRCRKRDETQNSARPSAKAQKIASTILSAPPAHPDGVELTEGARGNLRDRGHALGKCGSDKK